MSYRYFAVPHSVNSDDLIWDMNWDLRDEEHARDRHSIKTRCVRTDGTSVQFLSDSGKWEDSKDSEELAAVICIYNEEKFLPGYISEIEQRAAEYRKRTASYLDGELDELTLTETLDDAAKCLEITATILRLLS